MMLEQPLQHPWDVIHMFLFSLGIDQNVSEINKHKEIQHISEDIIYQGLKNSGGVGESKWHHQVLIVATGCDEGCFPLIPLTEPNEMVGVAKVELGENPGPLKKLKGR